MSDSDPDGQKPKNNTNTDLQQTDDNKGPKHLRLRYWTSFEDMRLVEMWLRHKDAVTSTTTNLPIFRTIAEGMKECGFHVNAQECRRKIHSLNTKFLSERQIGEKNSTESTWRLYPLIMTLHEHKYNKPNPMHQAEILTQLLNKISPHDPTNNLAAIEPCVANSKSSVNMPKHESKQQFKKENGFPYHEKQQKVTEPCTNPYKRIYTARRKRVSCILNRHFTAPRLTQLRADNADLILQRDADLHRLQIEEKELKLLESILSEWQTQQVRFLHKLQTRTKAVV